jgi:hypothetical protein
MAGLESLSNPLERLPVLNGAGSLSGYVKTNPLTNSADWDVDQQYFLGDSCRSPLDGHIYVYTGGDRPALPSPPPNEATGPITSIRGGVDPSLDSVQDVVGGYWLRNAPLSSLVTLNPTEPTVSATWVVTDGVLALPEVAGATYMAVVQGVQAAAAYVAGDKTTVTLTPSGTGAAAVTASLVPNVSATPSNFSFSTTLVFTTGTGAGPFTVTLTGAILGSALTGVTGVKVTLLRLA